jgi:hypothetical protein
MLATSVFALALLTTGVDPSATTNNPENTSARDSVQQVLAEARTVQSNAKAILDQLKSKKADVKQVNDESEAVAKSAAQIKTLVEKLDPQQVSMTTEEFGKLKQLTALLDTYVNNKISALNGPEGAEQRSLVRAGAISAGQRAAMIEKMLRKPGA